MLAAGAVHSNCLQIAVIVGRAQFLDGTVWSNTRAEKELLWTNSLNQSGESSCEDSSEVDFRELRKGTAAIDPPSRHLGITESYSAVCPVHRINGDLTMQRCAW